MALDSTNVAMPLVSAMFVLTGVQWIKSLEASSTNACPGVPVSVACSVPSNFGGVIETFPMLGGGVEMTMVCVIVFELLLKFPAGSENSAVTKTELLLAMIAAGITTVVAPFVRLTGAPSEFVPLHLKRTWPLGAGTPGFNALTRVTKVMFWFVRAGFSAEVTSATVPADTTVNTPLLEAKV